jgi:hypothetical protein
MYACIHVCYIAQACMYVYIHAYIHKYITSYKLWQFFEHILLLSSACIYRHKYACFFMHICVQERVHYLMEALSFPVHLIAIQLVHIHIKMYMFVCMSVCKSVCITLCKHLVFQHMILLSNARQPEISPFWHVFMYIYMYIVLLSNARQPEISPFYMHVCMYVCMYIHT